MPDYYPTKRAELPEWYQNFVAVLAVLKAKYGITQAMLDEIDADNLWIQYWVPAIFEVDNQVDATRVYFDTLLKDPEGSPSP